jgi:hypothetical protein
LILDRIRLLSDICRLPVVAESRRSAGRGDSRVKRIVAVVAMPGLSGCAGLDSTGERVLTGATIGAGAGAVAGALTGGLGIGAGAAIGAAVGAGTGYVIDQASD